LFLVALVSCCCQWLNTRTGIAGLRADFIDWRLTAIRRWRAAIGRRLCSLSRFCAGLTKLPLDEDRAITRGHMVLSEKTLARVSENEPDIYAVQDLKVRFK